MIFAISAAFARRSADPLPGLVFFLVLVIYLLLKFALGKSESAAKEPPLASFRFPELEGPHYPNIRTIYTKIRGVSFENPGGVSRQCVIRNFCHAGDLLLLMREPGNPVDRNAIAVIRMCKGLGGKTEFGELLGHLSKEIAREVGPLFEEGPVGVAEVLEITGDLNGSEGGNVGVDIRAEIYMPEDDEDASKGAIHSRRRPRPRRPVVA